MLTSLAIIFLLGLLMGSVFNKLKLPSLMGMILTGILLSPHAFNLLDEKILTISPDLRQLALVIILTRAGLSLDIKDLKKVGRPAILMCFVPACFEILAVVIIAPKILGITILEAAIMGAVIAAVSPAIIVPRMINLIDKKIGVKNSIPQLIMAGASVDDIFVIVLLLGKYLKVVFYTREVFLSEYQILNLDLSQHLEFSLKILPIPLFSRVLSLKFFSIPFHHQ